MRLSFQVNLLIKRSIALESQLLRIFGEDEKHGIKFVYSEFGIAELLQKSMCRILTLYANTCAFRNRSRMGSYIH